MVSGMAYQITHIIVVKRAKDTDMNLDHTFPGHLMVVGYFVLFPIALYYRLKSQATGERLDRRPEGTFILAALPLLALMLWAGMIAYMDQSSVDGLVVAAAASMAALDGCRSRSVWCRPPTSGIFARSGPT